MIGQKGSLEVFNIFLALISMSFALFNFIFHILGDMKIFCKEKGNKGYEADIVIAEYTVKVKSLISCKVRINNKY